MLYSGRPSVGDKITSEMNAVKMASEVCLSPLSVGPRARGAAAPGSTAASRHEDAQLRGRSGRPDDQLAAQMTGTTPMKWLPFEPRRPLRRSVHYSNCNL